MSAALSGITVQVIVIVGKFFYFLIFIKYALQLKNVNPQ